MPPKKRSEFIVTKFHVLVSPMAAYPFCEIWESRVWNRGIFRIPYYVLSKSYVEFILEAKIFIVFPYLDVVLGFSEWDCTHELFNC